MTVRSPCVEDRPERPELPERLRDLMDMFSMMEDRQDRVQALIGIADSFEPVPARIASPPYPETARVPNCESEAFAFAEPLDGGRLRYWFAIENPQGVSAMAMAKVIDDTLSGEDPEQVLRVPPDVIYALFGRELSMGKSAGLMGMIQMVHALTRQAAKSEQASTDAAES